MRDNANPQRTDLFVKLITKFPTSDYFALPSVVVIAHQGLCLYNTLSITLSHCYQKNSWQIPHSSRVRAKYWVSVVTRGCLKFYPCYWHVVCSIILYGSRNKTTNMLSFSGIMCLANLTYFPFLCLGRICRSIKGCYWLQTKFCSTHQLTLQKGHRQRNAMARISNCLEVSASRILYNSFVTNNFNYCQLVWHFCAWNGKYNIPCHFKTLKLFAWGIQIHTLFESKVYQWSLWSYACE